MIECLITNFGFTVLLAALLALSEWVGADPNIKANSLYQLIYNFLKNLKK